MTSHSKFIQDRLERERKYLKDIEESLRGHDNGEKGNPIPENPSTAYREGYACSVRGILASKKTLLTTLIFALIWAPLVHMHEYYRIKGEFNEQYRAREERIVEFYNKHGSCPSNLSSAGIDGRVQLWINEVEGKN